MLLYIMLYVRLAYLMLLAALSNAVCFYNGFFFIIDFCKCFQFLALSWLIDTVCLFQESFFITHSTFDLLVFSKSMFTQFFI